MPCTDDNARIHEQDRTAKLNQNDGGDRHGRRGHGVQHNTELAVVGIAGGGVRVHHLHHGEQGQQRQAQHRHRDGKTASRG